MQNNTHTVIKPMYLWMLVGVIILINSLGLLTPLLDQDDPALYANIAKHIALSGNWVNLMMNNQDWLDKPHFPFWITAASFKLFGINSFAYLLPGFAFNILGSIYSYKLAKRFYTPLVGLLAIVIYLSSLHLLVSSINLRAEAYLVGEIMPACYYWYLYYEEKALNFKYLILASIFTGLAVMTKGIFLFLTVFSGLFILWLYKREWSNFFSKKWLLALLGSFICILPELIALFLQFDLHPEKTIFGRTHVSGLKFFFIDSQFGRFFNNGPIHTSFHPWHYLYFIHTFAWAFLPWTILFIMAIYNTVKQPATTPELRHKSIYLWASFIPTFVLFSATSFQLDYYTNILIPFAAIITANYLYNTYSFHKSVFSKLYVSQIIIGYGLLILVVGLSYILLPKIWGYSLIGVIIIVALSLYSIKGLNLLIRMLWLNCLSSCLFFGFSLCFLCSVFIKYDIGYQVTKYMHLLPIKLNMVDYKVNSFTLNFYNSTNYLVVNDLAQLSTIKPPYYLFSNQQDMPALINYLNLHGYKHESIYSYSGINLVPVIQNIFKPQKLQRLLIHYEVMLVN